MILPLVLAACSTDPVAPPPPDRGFRYPLDDVLRLNHVQALGTHNSYHLSTEGVDVEEWSYDMAPLDVQLGGQGVRQFEIDVHRDPERDRWAVYHIGLVDEQTTCVAFTDCLGVMKDWSDRNPAHHPIVTLIEVKDEGEVSLPSLEAELLSVWPEDRLVTPDLVQGDAASLRDAVADVGWPTLGELRGRALFVLHDSGALRDEYTDALTTTAGRAMFPDADTDLDLPIAAFASINDAVTDADPLAAALAAGFLVRTRADSGGDVSGRDAAIASGAQFASTDFPDEVEIPGGTPSRCNPVTAPDECHSEAIEDPAFIAPE